jgi:hypothetical protein
MMLEIWEISIGTMHGLEMYMYLAFPRQKDMDLWEIL